MQVTALKAAVSPESEWRKKMGLTPDLFPLEILVYQPCLRPVVTHRPAGTLVGLRLPTLPKVE